jgi:hypothetical protein
MQGKGATSDHAPSIAKKLRATLGENEVLRIARASSQC